MTFLSFSRLLSLGSKPKCPVYDSLVCVNPLPSTLSKVREEGEKGEGVKGEGMFITPLPHNTWDLRISKREGKGGVVLTLLITYHNLWQLGVGRGWSKHFYE